jgi:hypothetical protein
MGRLYPDRTRSLARRAISGSIQRDSNASWSAEVKSEPTRLEPTYSKPPSGRAGGVRCAERCCQDPLPAGCNDTFWTVHPTQPHAAVKPPDHPASVVLRNRMLGRHIVIRDFLNSGCVADVVPALIIQARKGRLIFGIERGLGDHGLVHQEHRKLIFRFVALRSFGSITLG